MDNNASGSNPPNMGMQDNAVDILRFDELERNLNALLEDDELDYFSTIAGNIESVQTQFLANFKETTSELECYLSNIRNEINRRERELKSELNEIFKRKFVSLESQINVCNSVPSCSRSSTFFEQTKCGCVQENFIKFSAKNYDRLLQDIKSFGSIESASFSNIRTFKGLTPKLVFGTPGGNSGQFCRPWGITTDAAGRILVSDRSNHRIQIFNEFGHCLFQFGRQGSGAGEFNKPSGITVDANNRIIIADKDNHRVQVFTHMGKFLLLFGRLGSKPTQLHYPWGVAANRNLQIAVADSKNNRVQLYSSEGILLSTFEDKKIPRHPKASVRILDSPRGLAFRSDGSLLITDFNNHYIILVRPDFKKYAIFGREGHSKGQFFRPQGIDVDSSGNIIVSDSKNFRIQMFDSKGNIIKCFGSQGSQLGEFDCPQDICFHPKGGICVVDLNNNRIQVF